ncbi:MAG: EamA/RhaT family transporter, partial [Candidatus Aminicenantes bacterium]|nr:EamA/RhaT family transporter [Candidatus Aminicenantes bacterium]
SAYGLLLGIYGLVTKKEMYAISLGFNLNLAWGVLMLAIGGGFLLAAFLKRGKAGR